jgi:hypothetical protein
MKKFLFATALIGFAIAQTNAQNPATISTTKTPANAQVADPAAPAAKPGTPVKVKPAAKPAAKVAHTPSRTGKPALRQAGVKDKKVKAHAATATPAAPATENKK